MFFLCPCIIADQKLRNLPDKKVIKEESVFIPQKEESLFENFLEMAVIVNEETWNRYKKEIEVGISRADVDFLTVFSESYRLTDENDFKTIKFEKPVVFILGK